MDEIERMAREAGCFTPGANRNYWAVTDPALARFAELVRAQEQERCAKVCESMTWTTATPDDCAAAIRST